MVLHKNYTVNILLRFGLVYDGLSVIFFSSISIPSRLKREKRRKGEENGERNVKSEERRMKRRVKRRWRGETGKGKRVKREK